MRLKADLHVHSSVSDGRDPPDAVVVEAHRKGVDVIAITDHDSFEGGLRGYRFARSASLEVVVIVGAEVRTEAGDVLVLCDSRPLQRIPRDPGELLDAAHESGCLAVPAHPFDARRHGVGRHLYLYRWDAVEVFNALSDPLSNRRAEQAARELGLPGIAASDAHVAEAIASAYTLIDSEPSAESVLEAIRAGRVKPVPGRPSINALLRTAAWSVERRLGVRDRRRLEKMERLWAELE